jgi:hypothetical protein
VEIHAPLRKFVGFKRRIVSNITKASLVVREAAQQSRDGGIAAYSLSLMAAGI